MNAEPTEAVMLVNRSVSVERRILDHTLKAEDAQNENTWKSLCMVMESGAILYANIDYRQRDDFLYIQAHYGYVMCCPASLYRFAYVVDRDPRAVTKFQINTNKFY